MTGLIVAGTIVAYVATGDWLAALAVLTLGGVYRLLKDVKGPPVLFLALSYQWMQTSIGLFYGPLTGRPMLATTAPDWGTMVLIGLGCVLSLAVGIRYGVSFVRSKTHEEPIEEELFSMSTLIGIYIGAFVVTGILQSIAFEYPLLREPMALSSTVRLMVFYFAVRRLLRPIQVLPLLALLGFEVLIGLTGFFANFKEPMLMTAIALLEVFDGRRASHWLGMGVLTAAATMAGIFWMGVRGDLRSDFEDAELLAAGGRSARFARLQEVGSEWWSLDKQETIWTLDSLVERQWVIYYPALAIARVPSVIPHTGGELMWKAIQHVAAPRILFPNKVGVGSDSDLVRKYSGVWVAGEETETSIAFGYAAESYVDFGLPVMFGPVLIWGFFVGMCYQFLRSAIRHEQILVPLLAVVFWTGLYLFERSWPRTIGMFGTLVIYLGGGAYIIDRWLMQRQFRRHVRPAETSPVTGMPAQSRG